MEILSDYGRCVIFDKEMQSVSRLKNMSKTVYNVGTGVAEEFPSLVPWLCSLTYKDVKGWKPEDITYFLNRVRTYLYRRDIKLIYCWVAELQKRGALHYHIIIWLPKGFKLPKFQRFGWWNHGFTDQKVAKKGVGYLMKYISKTETKNKFPKNVRIYGFGGVSSVIRQKVRFYRSPQWIRNEILDDGRDYKSCDIRRYKGGRVDLMTGQFFESRWFFYFFAGKPVFLFVDDNFTMPDLFLDICYKWGDYFK